MKQRLVGTLVLGSLALILIPVLLDGEGVERPPLSATIPPAPVFDTAPLPDPERPAILADTPTSDITTPDASAATDADADSTIATDTSPPADASTEAAPGAEENTEAPVEVAATTPPPAEETPAQSISEPALDAASLPEAWTVRLGSFGNRANADTLVARLLAAGHKAYIRPVMSGDVALNGVFVGPVLTRNEAVALQNELKTSFRLDDALVQRYDIAQ